MNDHDIPGERDLPAGRLPLLKDDLMTRIAHDDVDAPQPTPVRLQPRWRRLGLVAATLAVGLAVTTSLVVGDDGSASANTAMRNAEGDVIITLREGKHPEDLQRRLNDLGVPAVVDFLESGFGCDPARSTGWVPEPPGEELFGWSPDSPEGEAQLVLHPELLEPGQTAVFAFQIDEHEDRIAASVRLGLSTAPVGPCVPIADSSIVDAEEGISGG